MPTYLNPLSIILDSVDFMKYDTEGIDGIFNLKPIDFYISEAGTITNLSITVDRGNESSRILYDNIEFSNGKYNLFPQFYLYDTDKNIIPDKPLSTNILFNETFGSSIFHSNFNILRDPKRLIKGAIFNIFVNVIFTDIENINNIDFTEQDNRETNIFFYGDPTSNVDQNIRANMDVQLAGKAHFVKVCRVCTWTSS